MFYVLLEDKTELVMCRKVEKYVEYVYNVPEYTLQ